MLGPAQTVPGDEWVQWAAQNLACGISDAKVIEELGRGGVSEPDATALVASLRRSPIFAAAERLGAEVRKWTSLADALLSLEEQRFDFTSVPRVSNLPADEFHRDYYAANRPVIIEDVADKWPALEKWSLQFLRERFGEEMVSFQRGRSPADHRDSFIDHSRTASLNAYIDLIEREDRTNDYYLIAHDRLLDRPAFAPLFDDIVFDDRYFDPIDRQGRVFFWLGPQGSTTPMHRDLGNVFLAQIRGRKSIKLVPSKQMHKVYNEIGYHSEVDFEKMDSATYPFLRDIHLAEAIVAPGELLFIPLGWWHHVKALDQTITITGNNFRFSNAFAAIF